MEPHETIGLDPHERRTIPAGSMLERLLVVVGLVALVAAYLLSVRLPDGARRFWFAYLVSFGFLLSLSLGALFFVTLQHLTRSGWSVVVRRPAEIVAANLPLLAVLFLPILAVAAAGHGTLYHWAQPGEPIKNRAFLNLPFFAARWVIYFAIWSALATFFWKWSVRQDTQGRSDLTLRMEKLAGPGMVLFGLTTSFASFDLLMSLDAHWFSTIFGVYFFAGAVVGFFAFLIVSLMTLQRLGWITRSVTVEHYHDMGKWLFGFVFFWGYIAFCQYMLIWYGNIPEETGWFIRRGLAVQAPNAWSAVVVTLLFGHLFMPFAGLLSRHVKRHRAGLAFWAVWLLIMHWLDLSWLVMPELTTDRLPLVVEVPCLIGLGSLFAAGLVSRAARASLIPVNDPRLSESLAFENM